MKKKVELAVTTAVFIFSKNKKKSGVVEHNKIFCRVKAKGEGLGI